MPKSCLLFLLLLPGLATAGVLRTNSGKVIEGEIKIDSGSLQVRNAGGVETFPFHDVLYLDLRPGRVGRAPVEQEDPRWRDLSKWIASNVGMDRDPPQLNTNAKTVRFDAAGLDIGPKETLKKDQFVYLHRPLIGDGTITARVEEYVGDGEAPRCGIMFREDLWTDAPYVMISVTGSNVYLQHRPARGQESRREAKADINQRFMRLSRTGNRFVASVSSDGSDWREIGALEMQFKSDALIGLAAASRKKDATRAIAFSAVQVKAGEAKAAQPWSERQVERGLLLRDGTLFRGEFQAFDQTTVRFTRPGTQQQSLPLADVARILFRKPKSPPDQPPQGEGVLLSNGQFIAGQIKSIDGGTLTLSSVLFGIKRYAGHDIAHAVLHAPGSSTSAWEIESRDGARFCGNDLRLMNDGVHFTSPLLGQIKLNWYELAQVRPGGGRAVPLSQLPIARVAEGDSFALDALPGELPLGIGGAEPLRVVGVIGKTSLVWDLGGKYSMLAVDCAVPDAASSDAPVRFIILGDGKELYRGDPMTRRTPAASLSLDVSGVKSLTLRSESHGLPALWAEPYLIKAP